jgi:hypothetical protein
MTLLRGYQISWEGASAVCMAKRTRPVVPISVGRITAWINHAIYLSVFWLGKETSVFLPDGTDTGHTSPFCQFCGKEIRLEFHRKVIGRHYGFAAGKSGRYSILPRSRLTTDCQTCYDSTPDCTPHQGANADSGITVFTPVSRIMG